jgi:hypothetical protein
MKLEIILIKVLIIFYHLSHNKIINIKVNNYRKQDQNKSQNMNINQKYMVRK